MLSVIPENTWNRVVLESLVRDTSRRTTNSIRKVVEMAGEGAAMAQLKARRYAEKYRGAGEPINLVAVEFSRETCNVTAFEVEAG